MKRSIDVDANKSTSTTSRVRGIKVKDVVSILKLVLLSSEIPHLDVEFWVLIVVVDVITTTHTYTGFIAPYSKN